MQLSRNNVLGQSVERYTHNKIAVKTSSISSNNNNKYNKYKNKRKRRKKPTKMMMTIVIIIIIIIKSYISTSQAGRSGAAIQRYTVAEVACEVVYRYPIHTSYYPRRLLGLLSLLMFMYISVKQLRCYFGKKERSADLLNKRN